MKGVIRICGGHPSTIHDLSVLWDEMTIGEVKKGSSKAFTDKNQIDLYQNHLRYIHINQYYVCASLFDLSCVCTCLVGIAVTVIFVMHS